MVVGVGGGGRSSKNREQIGVSEAPGSILIDSERGASTFFFFFSPPQQSDSHLSFIIRAPHFHRPLGTGPGLLGVKQMTAP